MKYEHAELTLKKELDEHYMKGASRVRIVHGRGRGVLKNMVREYLEAQPFIGKYYEAPFFEGGPGVTVAEFK